MLPFLTPRHDTATTRRPQPEFETTLHQPQQRSPLPWHETTASTAAATGGELGRSELLHAKKVFIIPLSLPLPFTTGTHKTRIHTRTHTHTQHTMRDHTLAPTPTLPPSSCSCGLQKKGCGGAAQLTISGPTHIWCKTASCAFCTTECFPFSRRYWRRGDRGGCFTLA